MRFYPIIVLAIAASSVTGTRNDTASANSIAIDRHTFNSTTYGHQLIVAKRDTTDNGPDPVDTSKSDNPDSDTSPSDNSSSEAEEKAVEEREDMEEGMEVMEDIAAGIEDSMDADANTPPLAPDQLCSMSRKPRCCDGGGKLYKDGCEKRALSVFLPFYPISNQTHAKNIPVPPGPPPANRDEFRETCTDMDKIAMCCYNTIDMVRGEH